jgi:hypothetical protein
VPEAIERAFGVQAKNDKLSRAVFDPRKKFLKAVDVANFLGWDVKTLKNKWKAGEPAPTKRVLGPRSIGCTVGDVEDFLDRCVVP